MPNNVANFGVDVMAIGAHPDDIEFGCGGILAKIHAEGKSSVLVDLTSGEKGTNGTPEERRKEGMQAAKIVGAKRLFLDFPDCEVFDTYEGRLKLTQVIREYRPRLILAPLWKGEMNHPDHLATGLMARYAFRYARLKNILPEWPIHNSGGIMHYLYPTIESVDFLIDITDYVEIWKKMMACHVTQHRTFNFTDWNLLHAARLGSLMDRPYAQGLIKGVPVIIDDLMSISKTIKHS